MFSIAKFCCFALTGASAKAQQAATNPDDELAVNEEENAKMEADMNTSFLTLFARDIKNKIIAWMNGPVLVIPFNEDLDFRLADGKRWWDVCAGH